MNMADQLLDAWRINCSINQTLLDALTDAQFDAKLAKGKAVDGQFAHIHNVRRMWLRAIDPAMGDRLTKLEKGKFVRPEIKEALLTSDVALGEIIKAGLESGRVKSFKPHPPAFVCYMMAHEGNHRAQIEVALRQAGLPLSVQLEFAQWEWGKI
jgi:uncharacterized damage-inducible protein DinB